MQKKGIVASVFCRFSAFPRLIIAIVLSLSIFALWSARHIQMSNRLNTVIGQSIELQDYNDFIAEFGKDEIVICFYEISKIDYSSMMRLYVLVNELKKLPEVDGILSFLDAIPREERANKIYFDNFLKRKGTKERLHSRAKLLRLVNGRFVSDDLRKLAIIIRMNGDKAAFKKIKAIAKLQLPDKKIHFLGYALVEKELMMLVTVTNKRLLPVAILVGSVICFLLYRRIKYLLAALAAVGVTLFWLAGSFPYLNYSLNPFSTMLFPLVLSVALTMAVHVLSAFLRKGDNESERVFVDVALPTVLCAVTTFIGFISLTNNKVEEVRMFGFFAALGCLFSLLSALLIIPAIFNLFSGRRQTSARARNWRVGAWIALWTQRVIARRKLCLGLCLVLVLFACVGLERLPVSSAAIMGFHNDNPLVKAKKAYEKGFGGLFAIEVIVTLPKDETIRQLHNFNSLVSLQKELIKRREFAKSLSITDLLMDVAYATKECPQKIETQHYLDKMFFLVKPLSWKPLIRTFLSEDSKRVRLHVTTTAKDSQQIAESAALLKCLAEKHLPNGSTVVTTGRNYLSSRVHLDTMKNQLYCFAYSLLAIFIVLVISFRSLFLGLLSLLPNIIPLVLTFGVMGWLGAAFNVSTGMILCVTIGVIVDDTIHYLHHFSKYRQRGFNSQRAIVKAAYRVGQPIVVTSTILILGMAILWLSPLKMVGQFGIFTALTIAWALLGDLILLPIGLMSFARADKPNSRELG